MKKTIQIDGYSTNEFSGYHKISDIEEYLEEMKAKGYTHIDIIYDAGYEEVDFVPYYERLETDAEYERRMSREQSNLSAIEQSEIALMNRLKEKYG
jgi:citrate synthase